MWVDNAINTDDPVTIANFVAYRSKAFHKYIQQRRTAAYFSMWYKTLNHSDLTTRGKRTNSSDGFDRNLLYYLSVSEMLRLKQEYPEKKFECAKQSNIGMPKEFYKDLNVPDPRECKNHPMSQNGRIKINDFVNVWLVKDTAKYFSLLYSKKIMELLGKEMPDRWEKTYVDIESKNDFVEIDLHEAVHGIGVEADQIFHSLRLSMFLNDTIIFVIEHSADNPNLFIMLEKNVLFYYLLGLRDKKWADLERLRRYQERVMIKEGITVDPPDQLYDNEWDNTFLP